MQKKLIAAAVAGLIAVPALAQTNVTISGRFAMGYENYKLGSCATGFSCNSESRVSDQSSRLIFNVMEDLGGGLSAWGQYDLRGGAGGAVDIGTWTNGGNSGLGLMSKQWGKFTLGRWDIHYQEIEAAIGGNRAGSLQTLTSNGLMSQVGGVAIAEGNRTPNLMMWDSPNWNGFTARLAYSSQFVGAVGNEGSGKGLSGTGNPGSGDAWHAALRYNNGPWTGGFSYFQGDTESGTTGVAHADQTSWRLWGGYTFAMGLKVGLGYDRSEIDAGINGGASTTFKRSAWTLPVSYAFGPHKVYGSYAKANDMSNTTGLDTGAHVWGLGYDYAFSKRTSAGIFYTQLNNKSAGTYQLFAVPGGNGATVAAGGEDPRQIYIGMAHNF